MSIMLAPVVYMQDISSLTNSTTITRTLWQTDAVSFSLRKYVMSCRSSVPIEVRARAVVDTVCGASCKN